MLMYQLYTKRKFLRQLMITCRLRDAVLMLRRLTSQEARAEEKASIRTKQERINK